jgi:hypothetical protein
MNISNSPSVTAAVSGAQSAQSDDVNMHVLKKALNTQAALAVGLLQAIPQPAKAPALAAEGSVGRIVNTFA